MPVLMSETLNKAIGFRCELHKTVPALNNSADGIAECGICTIDAGVDAAIKKLGEIVETTAFRLDFYEQGAGENLRQKYAEWLRGIGDNPNDDNQETATNGKDAKQDDNPTPGAATRAYGGEGN